MAADDDLLNDAFEASLAVSEGRLVRIATGAGSIAWPAFLVLDVLVYPDALATIGIIRGVGTLLVIAAFFVSQRVHTYRAFTIISAGCIMACGCGVAAMTAVTEGHASIYFAGIMVVNVFAAALFTWPPRTMALVYGAILATYYVPIAFEPHVDPVVLTAHSAFIVVSLLVGVLGGILRNRLARQAWSSRTRLEEKTRELQEAHEFKDRMLQNVSHEFRTPLTLVLGNLDALLESASGGDAERRRLEGMQRHGMRLLGLINDLLILAKSTAGGLEVDPRPVDVRGQITRLGDDVRAACAAADITLDVGAPEAPVVYRLDAEHLEKCLLNLLSNAIKFTPAGGRIELAARDTDEGLVIDVTDDGPGVPPEARARIFERFQQASGGTTRTHGGTGIGLALVRDLVALHGGSVSLHDPEGGGARFRLEFPASLRAASGDAVPVEPVHAGLVAVNRRASFAAIGRSAPRADVRTAGTRGPHVLVAEDDPDLNDELVELLAPRYRVRAVSDGERALSAAIADPPHVLVSDVMMPKMDGLTLAKALRERPALKDTAIVLLTARGDLEDRVKGRQVGVDTYLTKPFHRKELLATVEGLLRSRMRVVGSYLLLDKLGEGGQSVVYRAENLETGASAALKIVHRRGLDDQDTLDRLRQEQSTLMRIRHPNIVEVFEHGDHEGDFYLAMELLDGRSVRSMVLDQGRLSVGTACAVIGVVADALAKVHAEGIIHRDVKSANIVVVDGDENIAKRVRLVDFGSVLDRAADHTSDEIVGTIPYMAPELLEGEPATTLSDIYALGVTLYELCTGRRPYSARDRGKLIAAIVRGDALPAHAIRPDVPEALGEVIARAMASIASARYQDARGFADALVGLGLEAQPEDEPVSHAPDDETRTIGSA